MLKPCFVAWIVLVGVMVQGTGVASAQTASTGSGQAYPTKPLRIVTSSVGGGGDFAARLIGQGLTGSVGWPVIVDNRAGIVPRVTVLNASPDGYTLLLLSGSLWIGPLLESMPYDAVRDFSPITITDRTPCIIVVHPSLAANSVKELIALAKAKPGALNYGSGNSGAVTHLAPELFKAMAGVNIVRIPYKSAGPAINDLIAGQVQLMFATSSSVAPHIKSGRLKALAVTTAQPSPLVPGLPTVAASGLPGYEAVTINSMFAPAKTPGAIINRLNQEIVRVLNQADVKEKFFNIGVDAVGSSSQQLAATMKSEIASMGKVIKDAGIRAD